MHARDVLDTELDAGRQDTGNLNWDAVKELHLSYYFGETIIDIVYTHDGNLN